LPDFVFEGVATSSAECRGAQEGRHVIVFARGSITNPDALAPYVDGEMRVVGELKAEGVIKAVYRRAAGPGVYLILEGPSLEAVRAHMDTLPFVAEGLMTLDYDEIYEI
jgi:hypothetical protein